MAADIYQYLKSKNISFVEHKHPAFFSVAEGEKYEHMFIFMHTKSLFLKDNKSNFYLVTLDAHKRLNVRFLREHTKSKKLEFASPNELLEHLNVLPGSVSLFSSINDSSVKVFIDSSILKSKSAGFHPNINTSTLELNSDSILKFIGSIPNSKEVIDLNNA